MLFLELRTIGFYAYQSEVFVEHSHIHSYYLDYPFNWLVFRFFNISRQVLYDNNAFRKGVFQFWQIGILYYIFHKQYKINI